MRPLSLVGLFASFAAVALAGCGATNPFDPATSKEVQAKSIVSGVLIVSGCDSAAGVTLALVRDKTVIAQTDALAAGDGGGDGAFVFRDVIPDTYSLEVRRDGLPAATGKSVTLLPGQSVDVGSIVVVPPSSSISGTVRLVDNAAADGATVIALGSSSVCGDAALVSQVATISAGTFNVTDLPPGTYEVRAFRNGYTPDREQNIVVASTGTGVPLARELLLHPASAVLHVVDDIGAPVRFTKNHLVNVEVLGFGGFSQMRLSTDPLAFDDPDAGFADYAPSVGSFDIGTTDGEVTIFGQLRDGNGAGGPAFVSDIYTVAVTLDTTPPEVRDVLVDNGATFLSGNEGNVRLIAGDTLSGVAGFQISLDPLDDTFQLTGTPAGFPGDFVHDQVVSFQNPAGQFVDGDFTVRARVEDAAGNVSDEVTALVRRDTTPPVALSAPGIVVSNAVGAQLFGVRADLVLDIGADAQNGVDGPVSLLVEQVGAGTVFEGSYTDHVTVANVVGSDGQSVTFRAHAKDLAGNALVVDSAPVSLNQRGRIFGTVLLEGVDQTQPLHGGTTIEATPAAGGPGQTISTLSAADGTFSIDSLAAGDYVVDAVRAGAVTQSQIVTVAPGVSREVFFQKISLARGALSGVFQKAGLQAGEDHAGILVEATHVPSGFKRQVFTSADGSTLLENLPEHIFDPAAGEPGYEIVASAAGFAASRLTGVSVFRDQTIALNDAASPIILARRVGDFEVCNTAPVNNTCLAVTVTRQASVFLNIHAENVTDVRISERAPFANENDATDPAFTPFPALDGSPFSVNLSDPDGTRTIFVQFKDNGGDADPSNDTLGPVLQTSVILDRVPPHAIGAIAVRRDFTGSFDTVLDTDINPYTNNAQARVRLAVTADEDPVQEAGVASVRVSQAADLSSAQSFAFSGLRDVVVDPGQILPEGRRDLFVAFCDHADNCTPAAQAVRVPIIIDRVAPSTLNGLRVKADNTAAQVVREPAGAPDDGVFTTFVTSTALPVAINVGTDPSLDTDGNAVSEIEAIRLSLEPTFLGRDFIPIDGLAAPGGTLTIPDFGLTGVQGTQRVFAQLRDHAGNVTTIGAGNPFFFDVVVDTVPPDAAVSLITTGGEDTFFRRDDPLQVKVESSGANAARSVRFSTDGLFDTEPTLTLTSSPQTFGVSVGAPEGSRTLVARLTDVAGNISERTVAFFFDQTPPDNSAFALCASCVTNAGALFASDPLGQVTLDLFAQDNSGFIDHVDVLVDGTVTDAGRTFARFVTTTMSPLAGAHTVAVRFVDAAGNTRTTSNLSITQDSVAPVPGTPPVTLLSSAGVALPDGVIVRARDLSLRMGATGADVMRLSEDSACVSGVDLAFTANATPLTVAAGEGVSRRVFARFSDRAGNVSACAAGRTFFLDETAPNVTLADFVSTNGLVNSRTTTVRVDATDASTAFGGSLTAQISRSGAFGADDGDGERTVALEADGSTNITYALLPAATAVGAGDGLKSVQIRIIDTAGNVVQRTMSVNLDETIPPKPTPIAPANNGFANTSTPTFTWTAAADATRYRIDIRRASDNVIVQSQAVTITSFTPTTPLANGDLRWAVHAFDAANNDSGIDPTFNPPNGILVTVDANAPTAPASLTVSGGSPTRNTRPTLTFTQSTDTQTAQAQIVYTVEIAADAAFTNIAEVGTVTGAGTFVPPAPLSDGSWFWRVTARDRASNATTAVAAAAFVVDTTAPVGVALAAVSSPKAPPVVLSWSLPTDADRVGVRLQLATNSAFSTPFLDSLQLDGSEDVTAFLTTGTTVFARVAAEDALGNRNFLSSVSFAFDSAAPTVPAGAVVVLAPSGVAFAADAPIADRNVNVQLNGGTAGEVVTARVSNKADCSNFTAFAVDNPGTTNNVVPWVLAAGGAFKQVFVRFVDDAGNASACTPSQRLRSTGVFSGAVTVSAGSSGITIGSNERAGVLATLTGITPGLPLTAVSDGSGNYEFPVVPVPDVGSTTYTLTFTKTGFTASGTVIVTAQPDQTVAPGPVTMTVQSGTVSGTTTVRAFSPGGTFCTSTDPQNATSAVVTLDGTAFTGEQITRTVAPAVNGAFTFANVPPGTYATTVNLTGYTATTSPANPFSLTGGATVNNRNFTLDDRTAPTSPLLRSEQPSPTSSSTALIDVDLASTDATAPSQNLRGYDVTRISLPLSGGAPSSTSLGVFAVGPTLSVNLADQALNRIVAVPVDCAGNRGAASEVQIIRDSVAPNTVSNVRVDNRDASVVVTWDANPAAENVTSYRVYYGAFDSAAKTDFTGTFAAQGPSPVAVTATTTPSATLSGLINETSFFVAVTALDAAGNESFSLSARGIASPSQLPIDLRAESQLGSSCVSGGSDIRGDLAANSRLAVVSSDLSGIGLQVFRLDDRSNLTLTGAVTTETRNRVALFDDFAVVYGDTGVSGSTRAYDLHSAASPTLVSNADAFDSCSGCVFRDISTDGYAADSAQTFYAATYLISGTTERVATWRHIANTSRGLFTFTGGSFRNLNTNTPAKAILQAAELIFIVQSDRVGLYRVVPSTGVIEFVEEEILPVGSVPTQAKPAFASPYLFVPTTQGVSVYTVTPGTRTAAAGASGANMTFLGTFESRVNGGPQALMFSGSRILAFGATGAEQRILESFEQTRLSTRLSLANRSLPKSLGSVFLKSDTSLSSLTSLAAVTTGNEVLTLLHRNGGAIGCGFTHRSLQLKMFELGSPNALAEGTRVPRGGTFSGGFGTRTIWSQLRGGILTTTEHTSNFIRVKAYDVRDPAFPKFMNESAALAGNGGSPFGFGATQVSGIATRDGPLVYTFLATPTSTRKIAAIDVTYPDVAMRTVNAGSAMTANATAPENALGMVTRDGVLLMAVADSINTPNNKNYLATANVDVPSSIPSWFRVSEPAAVAGMSGAGLYVDGQFAYVGANDFPGGVSRTGNICVADVTNPLAPSHVRCVSALHGGSNIGRVFSVDGITDGLVFGADSGIELYNLAAGPPSVATASIKTVAPPGGVSQNMTAAGPFVYTTIGNSSLLPLGLLLGIDATPAANGTPLFTVAGSLNDADPGTPSQLTVAGDNVVIPMDEEAFATFLVQLF